MRTLRMMDVVAEPTATPWVPRASELARAIAGHPESRPGLWLAYQPQLDLDSGRVVGVEALARWEHPRRGAIPPARFVAVAEQSDLVGALGDWVLRRALADLAAWQLAMPTACELRLGVNVSMAQLGSGFVDTVQRACETAGIDPWRLTLELTETLPLEGSDVRTSVRRLRSLGVRVSLDDFGTGYASFEHLRCLPVDELKLDRSFVRAPYGPSCDAVVRAVRVLADDLGLGLVAEGVEQAEEHERLLAHGCRTAQGYLYARPMAAADLLAALSDGTLVVDGTHRCARGRAC